MPDIWPRASGVGVSQPLLGDCSGSEGSSQVPIMVKNPPANAGDMRCESHPWVGKIPWRRKWQFGDLAWRIPGTEEPGRLQSMGSQRAGHDWACMQQIPNLVLTLHRYQISALCFEGSNKWRGGGVLEREISPGF